MTSTSPSCLSAEILTAAQRHVFVRIRNGRVQIFNLDCHVSCRLADLSSYMSALALDDLHQTCTYRPPGRAEQAGTHPACQKWSIRVPAMIVKLASTS